MTLTIILSHVLAFLFGIGGKEVFRWFRRPDSYTKSLFEIERGQS
jgi:hypothetical protein